jgi:hypothetical protein
MPKLSRAQETTLRTIRANGGEMDGYAGQPGFYVNSLGPLLRQGLLEDLGTTRSYDEAGVCTGFATYNRVRMTEAGYAALGD